MIFRCDILFFAHVGNNWSIRCSFPNISKDLYKQLGGNMKPVDSVTGKNRDLYFDTDCIAKLVNEWDIDKKQLQISNPNMFFEGKKAILTPLHKSHKRGTSGSKWKRAYQSLKHNRSEFIKCASIENLLNALGALYILNVYYSNESFWMETPVEGRREYTVDSEVFTPFVCDASHILIDIDMTEDMMNRLRIHRFLKVYMF